jgi:hypothetical protein
MAHKTAQPYDDDWVTFPGGELEGKRPKVLCPACREQLKRVAAGAHAQRNSRPREHATRTLCFQCYRAELDRDKALKAAGALDTASDERFQSALPFEPVNRPRLEMLKEMLRMDRAGARTAHRAGVEPYTHRRRQAQIAARHALQAIAAGLKTRQLGATDSERVLATALHAAELQLPESWLPFVVAR